MNPRNSGGFEAKGGRNVLRAPGLREQAAEPHLMKMVEGTKKEAGCLYYGWTICGNKLHCRETYADFGYCLAGR